MSVSVPSGPNLVELAEFASAQQGKASSWKDIIQIQNYALAHTGARIPGHYYPSAATTTSSTFTQANVTTNQPDLDVWFPCSTLKRRCFIISTDALSFELQIFGTQVEARLTVLRTDTGGTVTTLTATQSGASTAWASASGGITYVSGLENLNLAFELEFRATSGTASLYTWAVHEKFLVASEMPDGSQS